MPLSRARRVLEAGALRQSAEAFRRDGGEEQECAVQHEFDRGRGRGATHGGYGEREQSEREWHQRHCE